MDDRGRGRLDRVRRAPPDAGHRYRGLVPYLAGQDPLTLRGLEQRQYVTLVGREVPIAAPEHVILHKLRFRLHGASERHLRDIRGILRVLGDTIDLVALESDAAAFGLTAAWKELQNLRD